MLFSTLYAVIRNKIWHFTLLNIVFTTTVAETTTEIATTTEQTTQPVTSTIVETTTTVEPTTTAGTLIRRTVSRILTVTDMFRDNCLRSFGLD